jgi:hypothetical protein
MLMIVLMNRERDFIYHFKKKHYERTIINTIIS